MSQEGRSRRLPLLLVALAALLAVAAWMRFGGGDTWALRIVQAHVDPTIDADRPLGEVFGSLPHLQATWTGAWGGNHHCASVALRVASLAEFDAACPHLLDPLRGLVSMDPRWAGLAMDQPLQVEVVFRVSGDGDAVQVEAFQVLVTEAWVEFKPACVEAYEKGIEDSISHSDDGSRARRYRLRHEGDRAFFDLGLNGPMLAGAGLVPPLAVVQRIAAWR